MLDSLRRDFPEEADLLTSSRELGSDTLERAKPERRKAIIKLLTASIKTERDQVEKLLYQIRSKMVLVARTKLFGAIISAASGALSAAFTYAGGGQQASAMISALVAMAGGFAAIIAEYFERSPSGIKIASAEEYGKLVEIRSSIERISRRMARDSLFGIDDQELETISKRLTSSPEKSFVLHSRNTVPARSLKSTFKGNRE